MFVYILKWEIEWEIEYLLLGNRVGNRVPVTGSMKASGWLFGIFINFDTFFLRTQRESRRIGLIAIENIS